MKKTKNYELKKDLLEFVDYSNDSLCVKYIFFYLQLTICIAARYNYLALFVNEPGGASRLT